MRMALQAAGNSFDQLSRPLVTTEDPISQYTKQRAWKSHLLCYMRLPPFVLPVVTGFKSTCSLASGTQEPAGQSALPPPTRWGSLPLCSQHPSCLRFQKNTLSVALGCHDQLDGSLSRGFCQHSPPAAPREMSDAGGRRGEVGRGTDGDNGSAGRGWEMETQAQERLYVHGNHAQIQGDVTASTLTLTPAPLCILKGSVCQKTAPWP